MKKFAMLCLIWTLFFIGLAYGDTDNDLEYTSDLGDCPCEIETYESDVEHGIIKSPNYPSFEGCNGQCIYKIYPHPNKSVSLYTSQFEISTRASLVVYSLMVVNDREITVPHAKIKRPASYYYSSAEQFFPSFVSAKNAGFEVHFKVHTNQYYTSFKISFDRNYEYEYACDYPIVEIGTEETIIQRPHQFRSASGCIYTLQAKKTDDDDEEDEMMINIEESEDSMVSVRTLDESGKRVFGAASTRARSIVTSAYNIEILSHKTTRTNGNYKMSKVTAKLIKRSCDCGQSVFVLKSETNNTQTIRSPGYPDLYCPKKDCAYEISAENSQVTDAKMSIFEVKLKATIGSKDSFLLRSDAKTYIDISTYKSQAVNIKQKFVIKQQKLNLNYQTFDEYSKRSFEMNVTRIEIHPECSCNYFKDKEYQKGEDKQIQVPFPAYCTYIYCSYLFRADYGYYKTRAVLDFQVKGAIDGDMIRIQDDKHVEKYKGSILHRVRRFEVIRDSELTFYRENFNATEPITLLYNYTKIVNDESCKSDPEIQHAGVDTPAIVISPGYPQMYANDLDCHFIVSVPENNRMILSIDEINIENFHDYVKIYEGNTTEGKLVKSYTGYVMHQVLNVSTPTALIVFSTDQSTTNRGFHITVTAHLLEKPFGYHHHLIVFVLLGLIISFIIGLAATAFKFRKEIREWLAKKNENPAPPAPENEVQEQTQAPPEPTTQSPFNPEWSF